MKLSIELRVSSLDRYDAFAQLSLTGVGFLQADFPKGGIHWPLWISDFMNSAGWLVSQQANKNVTLLCDVVPCYLQTSVPFYLYS